MTAIVYNCSHPRKRPAQAASRWAPAGRGARSSLGIGTVASLARWRGAGETLAASPQRGSFPGELLTLGIRDYRQAFFKPYRVIYRVLGDQVYVYLIADGRRDMQALLQRRLLGA